MWYSRKLFKREMNNTVKLDLNIESYFYSRNYKTIYFTGKLLNNIIFNNELKEERSAKVKVVCKPENANEFLQLIHQSALTGCVSSWVVSFEVDPENINKPLNKDGVRISTFQAVQ